MRKTIKILLICMLIFITIFNVVISSPVYGAVESDANLAQRSGGTAINTILSGMGGIVGIGTWIVRMPILIGATLLHSLLSLVATVGADAPIQLVTPATIFFNQIKLVDVNFLDLTPVGVTQDGAIIRMRTAVAMWYYVLRTLSLSILLLILIYIGIRMAISTIASEKAEYKRMLVDWVTSLALVFVLHYIIMFTINCNEALVRVLWNMAGNMNIQNYTGDLIVASLKPTIAAWGALACYFMMMIMTFAFLLSYIKRMLTVGFLILISPLIAITYSVDKVADKKSQALDAWLKEFVYNILIQPFHCILYLVFVGVALEILSGGLFAGSLAAGVLAIMCMKFIWDGEKIVTKIFSFDKASSLTASAASMAVATAAIMKLPSIAKNTAGAARKGINMAKASGIMKGTGKIRKRT